MTKPVVTNIKRHAGIAGQYEISATAQYDGEDAETVTFTGSVYGGPILMVTPSGVQFVSSAVTDRIGSKLTPEWVTRFFGGE